MTEREGQRMTERTDLRERERERGRERERLSTVQNRSRRPLKEA